MSRTERAERVVLVLILLGVGGAAAWVSFTHTKDWTLAHSPAETPEAFGWVNSAVADLVPVAALLEIRRRRRVGQKFRYPLFLVFAAGGLSLAAQLAVAEPSISGRVLSSIPAVAFMALTKLVLSGSGGTPETAPVVAEDQDVTGYVAPGRPEPFPRGDLQAPQEEAEQAEPVAVDRPKRPRVRRPIDVTRRLVDDLLTAEPTLTQAELGDRLGLSARRVRAVLASSGAS
ncbi:hypothetical protein ACTOB_006281 [Actinoplanes oblitus]|uniref:DUF2637 domain-containing protein n=1 Tax=Actinoplanes oblitus TaxID=3040509 RepID=A0ABY8W8U1_9ACTN|nr:hypothetical protein [Actinoplanes oblitus]WIM94266.1 hypothetical protein ACTOB_006281 [Actinoplanes oblitus]